MTDKNMSLWRNFTYAWSGLCHAFRTERNVKIHGVLALLVVLAGYQFDIEMGKWAVVILCIGMMLGTEILNTAIEYLGDAVSDGAYNETVRRAKDMSAAACLVVALMSVVIGWLVFGPVLLGLLSQSAN